MSFLLPNTQQHKVFAEIQDVFASTEMTKENLKYKKKKKSRNTAATLLLLAYQTGSN